MERLSMSPRERERKVYLEWHKIGKLTLREIRGKLNLSYRQVKRLWRRYREKGDEGLIHGNHQSPSNRAIDPNIKKAILAYYQTHYEGFGPTFAAEKLAEAGYKVNHETVNHL